MRENRPYGSEGGEAKSLPYPYLVERVISTSATVGIDGAAPIRCTQTEAAMLA